MTVKEFVKWIYPTAKRGEINPVFVTAQAALESGWGKSKIGNYNLFGITKGTTWRGPIILVTTFEYFSTPDVKFKAPECVLSVTKLSDKRYKYQVKRFFRDYQSLEQCLTDHLAILKKTGFSDAWPYRNDARQYVVKIQDCIGSKYATSPDYVVTMNKLFSMVEKVVKEEKL